MRTHLILFFLALFLLVSCQGNKTAGNVIAKEKMVQILSDIHIIDATLLTYGPKDSLYKYGTNRFGVLFKKYGVDSALFNKSLKYYAAAPDEMIDIYNQIDALLKAKNDSIGKVHAKNMELETKRLEAKGKAEKKRKADSLRFDSIKKAAKAIKLKINKRIQ